MNSHAYRQQDTLSDEHLVELYWQRNELAIWETERKYGAMLLSIARGILHDESDCEECRNDVYLRVWNAIPPAKPQTFPAYIAQIMRRIAIDRYHERNAKSRVPSEYTIALDELSEILASPETVESAHSSAELGRLINAYIKGLGARERYVFIGRYYMAETLEALAAELGVNASTVHRMLARLKKGLRVHLERNGFSI